MAGLGGSRTAVQAPPARPPRYSLALVADALQLSSEALAAGYVFDPELCGSARGGVLGIECDGSSSEMVPPSQPANVEGDPFFVWVADECSMLGFQARDWDGRATRALNASRSYWLARELWTGSLNLAQHSLNDAASTEVTSVGTGSLANVLALVEQQMAVDGRGERGMIHVTVGTLVLMLANNLVVRDGNVWVTAIGNVVVADAGYTGSGPGETNPEVDGTLWIYGTSMIGVQFGQMELVPGSFNDAVARAQMVDRSVNTVTLYAEQVATWLWDQCVHVAGQYDPAASAPGGGGGGDSAPDYTALLTAISAATSDTDTNTDALEALVTALGTNTDGIETLQGSTNTKLDTLHTDNTAVTAVEDAAYPATGHSGLVIVGRRSDTPAASGGDGDAIDPNYDSFGAAWVHPVKTSETIKATIAGLTNAAYAANEQLGTEITLAGAARLAGWGGVIGRLSIVDDLKVLSGNSADFDVYITDQSITGATDNNTFDDSDADIGNVLDVIRFTNNDNKRDHTSNTIYTRSGLSIPYTCVATSLFALLVTRTALSGGWSTATAIRLNLGILLD